eukprot:scaffold5904_cov350-Prasinococcus_capsulatus_cf.AAC.3
MAACPALAASRARTAAWRPARASSARSALRVTNGSRVRMMQVLSPRIKYYETLSYLPPLSDFEIEKQLQYITRNNWSPCIEFDAMSVRPPASACALRLCVLVRSATAVGQR